MATVLTDVNIYTVSKDGKQKSLLGIAKQFTTPDAEVVTVEKKGVGDLSGEKLPIGVKIVCIWGNFCCKSGIICSPNI